MNANSYLKTELSPYRLNSDAMKLLENLNMSFSKEVEEKIIILINAASLHPKMSKYQLSLSHKALGDCYYKNSFFQSALEQYNRALNCNEKIPVKRRIKELLLMATDRKISSLSPDTICDILQFPEYQEIIQLNEIQAKRDVENIWNNSPEELKFCENIRNQLIDETKEEDYIFDNEHESEINKRLNILGEPYKTEFYRIRDARKQTHNEKDILSLKDQELLDLEALERSAFL